MAKPVEWCATLSPLKPERVAAKVVPDLMAARPACGLFLSGTASGLCGILAADDVPGRLVWFAPFQPKRTGSPGAGVGAYSCLASVSAHAMQFKPCVNRIAWRR